MIHATQHACGLRNAEKELPLPVWRPETGREQLVGTDGHVASSSAKRVEGK
jgi:hypothetical protein